MTTVETTSTSADEILEAVAELAPVVKDRAVEVEASRRIPPDLLEELVAAGCFRMLLPRSHGGAGASPGEAMLVLEALSRADGSVGWTVMIGAGVWVDLVGLPRETFDALYSGGPNVMLAGVFNPSGVAEPVEGGYRVSGRWAFASGCDHSEWIYGNCIEEIDGDVGLRTVLFSTRDVHIEDTWHVLGLRGTGSHHFTVEDVVVPAERTCLTMGSTPVLDEPIVRIPPPSLISLAIGSVATGIAQGALDEISVMAASRMPLLASSSLATNHLFQHDLAHADTELRAVRALLHATADDAWATARGSEMLGLEQRARIRAAAVWATERSVAVVETAYRAGGGSAVYDDSALQRRLRDIHAVSQHFLVRPDTMTTAGAVFAGQEIDVPVF
jgi:indole-3-acetate monooxygenase